MLLIKDKPKRRSIKRNNDGLNFRRRRRKIDFSNLKKILLLIIELLLVIFLAYFVVISFGKQVECSNESMEPTYSSKDTVLVNTIHYSFHTPEAGDVIAFKPKSNVTASYSIKRVVAVPGDTVLIENGRLYINDEIYKDSFSSEQIENAGIATTKLTLTDDQYFVLGDNRNNSEDSRYESVGFVSIDDILGKVWIKYPFS